MQVFFFMTKIIIFITCSRYTTSSKTEPCHSPCILLLNLFLLIGSLFILSYFYVFFSPSQKRSYYYYYYYYFVSFRRDNDNNKRFFFIFFIHTRIRPALAPKRPLVFVRSAPPTMTHADGRLHPSPLRSRRTRTDFRPPPPVSRTRSVPSAMRIFASSA